MDYRNFEWILNNSDIKKILHLKRIPDHSTINRNLMKINQDMINILNYEIVKMFWNDFSWITAEDSTWLSINNKSSYFAYRSWKQRKNG